MILVRNALEIEGESCLGDLFTMAEYFECGCARVHYVFFFLLTSKSQIRLVTSVSILKIARNN